MWNSGVNFWGIFKKFTLFYNLNNIKTPLKTHNLSQTKQSIKVQ